MVNVLLWYFQEFKETPTLYEIFGCCAKNWFYRSVCYKWLHLLSIDDAINIVENLPAGGYDIRDFAAAILIQQDEQFENGDFLQKTSLLNPKVIDVQDKIMRFIQTIGMQEKDNVVISSRWIAAVSCFVRNCLNEEEAVAYFRQGINDKSTCIGFCLGLLFRTDKISDENVNDELILCLLDKLKDAYFTDVNLNILIADAVQLECPQKKRMSTFLQQLFEQVSEKTLPLAKQSSFIRNLCESCIVKYQSTFSVHILACDKQGVEIKITDYYNDKIPLAAFFLAANYFDTQENVAASCAYGIKGEQDHITVRLKWSQVEAFTEQCTLMNQCSLTKNGIFPHPQEAKKILNNFIRLYKRGVRQEDVFPMTKSPFNVDRTITELLAEQWIEIASEGEWIGGGITFLSTINFEFYENRTRACQQWRAAVFGFSEALRNKLVQVALDAYDQNPSQEKSKEFATLLDAIKRDDIALPGDLYLRLCDAAMGNEGSLKSIWHSLHERIMLMH